eukprot:COSAG05_NODE_2165_length_3447_cov_8.954002_1_plen_53_part_00
MRPAVGRLVPETDFLHRACERPIKTSIVFLDRVQNLQIHAARAKFYQLVVRE